MPQCSLPELRDDDPLDPSLTLDPLLLRVKGKEPQTTVPPTYIQRTKPVMTYTNDTRTASLNVGLHHSLRAREQLVGEGVGRKPGRLVAS